MTFRQNGDLKQPHSAAEVEPVTTVVLMATIYFAGWPPHPSIPVECPEYPGNINTRHAVLNTSISVDAGKITMREASSMQGFNSCSTL
ncbi:MAG: hypothetical protein HY356_08200 [Gammaproteobacteria bacterium]|nr:hypothetical protein [Gammaproteobacteria bacterium]